jgi:Holliday junction DNA helicase RuvA
MINSLKGILIQKSPTLLTVDVNGVGYALNVSMNTFEHTPALHQEIFILTEMIVREDSITLYGFHSESERQLFKLLISISGIGPKSAVGILSGISLNDFRDAIINSNTLLLQKLPGVGKKTAERLVVELKDKFMKNSAIGLSNDTSVSNAIIEEASLALESLGYSKALAIKAVNSALKQINKPDYTSEDLIKLSLKFTMK